MFFGPARIALWGKAGRHGCFVVAPITISLLTLAAAVRANSFAVDFDHGTWVAGTRVLAGTSPYVGPHSPEILRGAAFVYPAVAAVLSVPFSLLPRLAADGLFTALCVMAVFLTLRCCDVRDWRIYGLVFLWPAVTSGWETANLTLLLGLGIAGVWRVRDRPFAAGALVALLVSVKLFLWPLALWLLVTRRSRALGWAVAAGLVINLMAWATLGFNQVGRYLQLMGAVTKLQERNGYSVLALVYGDGRAMAYLAAGAVAAGVLTASVVMARRGGERAAFALSVVACLLVSPLVWLHYFALLITPLALARPRLSRIWFLPVLMWFRPTAPAHWQVAAALLIAALLTSVMVRAPLLGQGAGAARGLRARRPGEGPVAGGDVHVERLDAAAVAAAG